MLVNILLDLAPLGMRRRRLRLSRDSALNRMNEMKDSVRDSVSTVKDQVTDSVSASTHSVNDSLSSVNMMVDGSTGGGSSVLLWAAVVVSLALVVCLWMAWSYRKHRLAAQ